MSERMSNEEAEALLLEHQMQEGDACVICRSCADLLDARLERDEARKALIWAADREGDEALPEFVVSAYEAAVTAARAAREER